MKRFFVIFAAVVSAFSAAAALPQPDLIADIHFVGGQKASADPAWPHFANEFASPQALALRSQTSDKLATWLSGWLQTKLAVSAPDGVAALRPLFNDLQTQEWYLDMRTGADGQPAFALAIRAEAAHAQVWQAGLKPFFAAGTFKQADGWLYFESGPQAAAAAAGLKQMMAQPSAAWLKADINWPLLGKWYPDLKQLGLPETRLEVAAAGTNLNINGTCFFPENLNIKLDAWQVPANQIFQPFSSFTAVRGIAGWLSAQSWAQPFRLNPPVNQLFTWALNTSPFQTFIAVPVPSGAQALNQWKQQLPSYVQDLNARHGFIAPVQLQAATNMLALTGIPILNFFAEQMKGPAGDFLLMSGFPNVVSPRAKPLPETLTRPMANPNLVFFHWEKTDIRMEAQLQLSQTLLVLTNHRQLNDASVAYKWLSSFENSLGVTTTQVTQTAPDQFTFTRTATGGLTAFEFLALVQWLDQPKFPYVDLRMPPMRGHVKPAPSSHPPPPQMAPGH